jgi:hypothetical protein
VDAIDAIEKFVDVHLEAVGRWQKFEGIGFLAEQGRWGLYHKYVEGLKKEMKLEGSSPINDENWREKIEGVIINYWENVVNGSQ